jgi:hypothetical protein
LKQRHEVCVMLAWLSRTRPAPAINLSIKLLTKKYKKSMLLVAIRILVTPKSFKKLQQGHVDE